MEKPLKYNTIKEGLLLRKVGKSYKKFWAVIGSASLYLFKNSKDTTEVASIPLSNMNFSAENATKAPYPFEIALPDGTIYTLAANSIEERSEWISTLSQFVEAILSDQEEEDSDIPKSNFAFKREKLLLSYRYMKNMLSQQPVPHIIYLPQDEVMHRFGYEIAIRKLSRTFGALDTLYFKECQFGGDCMDDLTLFLTGYENINSLVFENSGKAANCDRFVSVIPKLPKSVDSLSFLGSLSTKGIHHLADVIGNQQSLVSLTLQNIPIKSEIITLLQGLNNTAVESLTLSNIDLGDAGVNAAFSLLSANKMLQNLTMTNVGASRNCKDSLSIYLQSDCAMSLNLSNNKLGETVDTIFSILAEKSLRLKSLFLADTRMTHDSIFTLCKMLQENNTIRTLDISENRLKDDAAKVICVALANNHTLCELRIRNSFKNIRQEDLAIIQNKTSANMAKSRVQVSPQQDRRRSPLSLLKENSKKRDKLLYLLGVGDNFRDSDEMSCNDTWNNVAELINDALKSTDEDPEQLPSIFFFDQQEIRYTLGNNKEIIFEMLRFLIVAQTLKNRANFSRDLMSMKESYMHKRGGKMKTWKRRWFALSGQYIFYYVNQSKLAHKGTIVLEDAKIEGTAPGMTEFSFSITTPSREYILSCDSNEDRQSWIEQIQAAKIRNTSEANTPLIQLKSQLQQFCEVYQSKKRDPHTTWILQWWFPLCIEVLSRFYVRRKQDSFEEIERFFAEQTKFAIFLLTGEYLYDRKFVRGFEGIVRVAHDYADAKGFVMERIHAMQEHFTGLVCFKHCLVGDMVQTWNNTVKEDPTASIHQELHSTVQSNRIFLNNALLDSEDFRSLLSSIRENFSSLVLQELLFMEDVGEANQRISASDLLRTINSIGPYRDLIFPPPNTFTSESDGLFYLLQEMPLASAIYKQVYLFLGWLKWLEGVWPQSHNKRITEINSSSNLYALRVVFVLSMLFGKLKVAPISVDNMQLYNKWTECRNNIDEALFHLASCAIHGFDKEDAAVRNSLEFIQVATTTTITEIIYSFLQYKNPNE